MIDKLSIYSIASKNIAEKCYTRLTTAFTGLQIIMLVIFHTEGNIITTANRELLFQRYLTTFFKLNSIKVSMM